MKTLTSVLTLFFICTYTALLTRQNGEAGKVIIGERSPVDLCSLPLKAIKPGVVLIKFTEKHEKKMDVNPTEKNDIFLI
jgi:hypothetical protein